MLPIPSHPLSRLMCGDACYPMLLSFIIIGFIIRYCKEGHDIAIFMASFIPIEICYIPAYNAVFAKDRYLKYFKQFEKQDEHWHKRWKRITLLFCIGSVLMFFISLGVVTLILSTFFIIDSEVFGCSSFTFIPSLRLAIIMSPSIFCNQ